MRAFLFAWEYVRIQTIMSRDCVQVIYDVRQDSDALFNQFGVRPCFDLYAADPKHDHIKGRSIISSSGLSIKIGPSTSEESQCLIGLNNCMSSVINKMIKE